MSNQRFGSLLKKGIRTVAAQQEKSISTIQKDIADIVGFTDHTVDYWCRGNIPNDHSYVEALVRYCVTHSSLDLQWAKSLLTQARYPDRKRVLQELFSDEKPYIFMCYERSTRADLDVALRISQQFVQEQFPVFFDSTQRVDEEWSASIQDKLAAADVIIILLSQASVHSEVVLWELETIDDLIQKQISQPVLLMVRLGYRESIPDHLKDLMADLDWTYWRDESDTPRLIAELRQAVLGLPTVTDETAKKTFLAEETPVSFPPPQALVRPASAQLEILQGTMDPRSTFYVERDSDAIAAKAIEGQGVTITIKGARQVGKSSLLVRVASAAMQRSKKVAYVDFQLLRSSSQNADLFYRHFCALVTRGLGLADQVDAHWSAQLPNPFCCTNYFSDYLLASTDRPVVVAMDEVDSIFGVDFRSDFFAMLRAWHNQRAFESIWKQLSLVLVTSTEPYAFIDSLHESPFNVGEVLDLEDFSSEQCADLNRRYGAPLSPDEETQLMALLNGHPYLTQRALYLVASQRISASDLFVHASDDNGPFGDHLRFLLLRLHNKQDLLAALRQVYREGDYSDRQVLFRLRGAGLVRETGKAILPRCKLYADFFKDKLDG